MAAEVSTDPITNGVMDQETKVKTEDVDSEGRPASPGEADVKEKADEGGQVKQEGEEEEDEHSTDEPSPKKARLDEFAGSQGTMPPPSLRLPPKPVNQTKNPLVCGSMANKEDVACLLKHPLPRLTTEQKEMLQKSTKFSMEQSIRMVLMKQTLLQQQQQAKSLQRHQALVLMCRVYVGSISFELREDTIRNAFIPFGPIKSINMSWDPITQKHKGFAFVEYEMPEAAQLALEQMNSVMIGGRNIKVGRPSNMPQVVIDEIMEEANHYNRIYVASVHNDLTEGDIKSVFEAFGKIRMCLLTPAPTPGKHKGYGFIEYEAPQSAQEAIASMNLFDLGGQYLRVGRAITPPGSFYGPLQAPTQMPTAAAVAAAAATAKIQAMDAMATNMGIVSNITAALTQQQQQQQQQRTSLATAGAAAGAGGSSGGLAGALATTAVGVGGSSVPPVGMVMNTALFGTAGAGALGGLSLADLSGLAGMPQATIPPPTLLGAGTAPPNVVQSQQLQAQQQLQQQQVQQQQQQQLHMRYLQQQQQNPTAAILSLEAAVAASGPPPASVSLSLATINTMNTMTIATAELNASVIAETEKHQEEMQKKLLEDNEPQTLRQQENMSIKGQSARHLVMQKLMRKSESTVVILRNMVCIDDVDEVLQDEITEECGRYGAVEHVIIYQEKQSEEDDAQVIVKIFVEFSKLQEAEAARESLNGRYFGGRLVQADLYDKNLYDHNDLSG